MSLADAAHEAGFADQSHMTRQFHQTYGVSPGRWRAMARGATSLYSIYLTTSGGKLG